MRKVFPVISIIFILVSFQEYLKKSLALTNLLVIIFLLAIGTVIYEFLYHKERFRKKKELNYILGGILFLLFTYNVIFISAEIYPFIAVYTFIYTIYASEKTILLISAPYTMVGIIKFILIKMGNNLTNETDKEIINMIILFVVAMIAAIVISRFIKNTVKKSYIAIEKLDQKNKVQEEMNVEIRAVVEKACNDTEKVQGLMNGISESVNSVAIAIEEIANGATATSEDINSQVAYMDKIEDKIKKTVESCEIMSEATKSTDDVLKKGELIVSELTDETNLLTSNSEEVFNLMEELRKECNEIASITDVISGIAEQTNLLALNASIEAARAGEMGRGFIVVASEVGKLAEQSKESTENISNIITRLQSKANKSSEMVSKLLDTNKVQNKLVNETKMLFDDIDKNVTNTEKNNRLVIENVNDVAKSSEVVVKSIMNISAVSEETTANTEETYALSQEHISQAEEANSVVGSLKEDIQRLEKYIK